jgi:phospholipase D-like protein
MRVLAAEFGTGQVFLSMLYFFLFFIWIWMLIAVFGDIFRSHDLSGGAKALWTIFVIVTPFLGVFVYLIARGDKLHEHAARDAKVQDDATRAYIRDAVSNGGSATDQVAQLANLKAQGVIDDTEFKRLKEKAIAT